MSEPRAKGAAGVAAKADAFDLLIAQHARIRDLFLGVAEATGAARREAFQRLALCLAAHEAAEEEVVHPLARQTIPGGARVVTDRMEEEQQANELLVQLVQVGPDAPEFAPMLERLRAAVLTHARAEERYEFNWLRAHHPGPAPVHDPGSRRR